jgi:hypothetical protein
MRSKFVALALAAAPIWLSACAMSNPILSSGPRPRVEDCMMIRQSTPATYACPPDGKSYTAVQLADIRTGQAASK